MHAAKETRSWEMTSPCGCTVCAGRPGIPPSAGYPWRRWHELVTQDEKPPTVKPPRPAAVPVAKPAPIVNILVDIQSRIDAVMARTDIGAGMKSMQIKNIMKKAW